MDDDWYWASVYKKDVGVAGAAKVATLAPLFGRPNVRVRFLQTNHNGDGGLRNTLHTRIIMVGPAEGLGKIFTGSAHLRSGSLQSNFEGLVILRDPDAVSSYRNFLEDIWARGLPAADMPIAEVPIN